MSVVHRPDALDATHFFSGASGCTSTTAFRRLSTTWSPCVFPDSLTSRIFASVSRSASSSAFLLPLLCYLHLSHRREASRLGTREGGLLQGPSSYLGLESLEFLLLLLLVILDLFLRLTASVPQSGGAIYGCIVRRSYVVASLAACNRAHTLALYNPLSHEP